VWRSIEIQKNTFVVVNVVVGLLAVGGGSMDPGVGGVNTGVVSVMLLLW